MAQINYLWHTVNSMKSCEVPMDFDATAKPMALPTTVGVGTSFLTPSPGSHRSAHGPP